MHRFHLPYSLWIATALAMVPSPTGVPGGPPAPLPREIRVQLEGDWIVARQGRDETAQTVKLRVWGRLREPAYFRHGFEQLDDDPEPEYVVVSRNPGTGPYYKLQIVDFRPDGILTWSLDSYGRPRVEAGRIYLGTPTRHQGAPSPVYTAYVFTRTGIAPAAGER